MKFSFMASDGGMVYTIDFMASQLGVSKSGYYKWRKNKKKRDSRATRELALVRKIEDIHTGSKKTYGSPSIYRILKGLEPDVSERKVERLMKKYGIRSKTKRKFKVTTLSNHKLKVAPNHLMMDFKAHRPNQIWVGDITYVPTKQGWLYLAIVLDVYSRRVVGWSLADHMRSELVEDALRAAIRSRKIDAHLIFHSDRGSQYASKSFVALTRAHGIVQSMSRRANCWDNSISEAFFARFKIEHMFWENYETKEEAKRKIFEWIELDYNIKRVHSSIGYVSPTKFEEDNMTKVA